MRSSDQTKTPANPPHWRTGVFARAAAAALPANARFGPSVSFDMLRMLLAPFAPSRFPFVVRGARFLARPLSHQPLCPNVIGPPALVMRGVAPGVPPKTSLAVPHGRTLEEGTTPLGGPVSGHPRPTRSRLIGRGRLDGGPR